MSGHRSTSTTPSTPLEVRKGYDFMGLGDDHMTFGIDVAYQDFRGHRQWHGNMIAVYGSEGLRDTVLAALTGPQKTCPFDDPDCGIDIDTPCPVCGALGAGPDAGKGCVS